MELLCVLAAVAALFCGCAVLTLKCRVPASVAPLTALSAIVAVLTLAAMAGVLYPAAWLLYLLCLAGGVWVAASCRGSTGAAQRLFTPGSVLFWGMALAFTVYFFVRQPMATDFDELSLWATAVKITKVNDSLYATAELGTPWAATPDPTNSPARTVWSRKYSDASLPGKPFPLFPCFWIISGKDACAAFWRTTGCGWTWEHRRPIFKPIWISHPPFHASTPGPECPPAPLWTAIA